MWVPRSAAAREALASTGAAGVATSAPICTRSISPTARSADSISAAFRSVASRKTNSPLNPSASKAATAGRSPLTAPSDSARLRASRARTPGIRVPGLSRTRTGSPSPAGAAASSEIRCAAVVRIASVSLDPSAARSSSPPMRP